MSQRRWSDGIYNILTGWDRPLQRFFLMIERRGDDPDQPFYSNLDDLSLPRLGDMTVEQVVAKLTEHKILIPPSLDYDLRMDRENDVGNLIVKYSAKRRPPEDAA